MNKYIKAESIFLISLWFILCLGLSVCYAEKIYFKHGEIMGVDVLYRNKESIWIKHSLGAVGIQRKEIERIENEDGSISKYDYESLVRMTGDSIKKNEYGKAIGFCNLLLKSFPEATQIHRLRGGLSQKVGDFATAINDYNFLIQNMAADAEILNDLGFIYARNKEYQKADELFGKAIKINPDLIEAHFNLAELRSQTKDYKLAIGEYEKVIDSKPQDTKAFYKLGMAYMNNANESKAIEQFNRILDINPEDNNAKAALEYLKNRKDK